MRQYANRIANTFTPLDTDSSYFMNLPTAVNLMGDYNIDGRFFVSASATIALTGGTKDDHKTSALTSLTVTPRYEMRHLGAYLPLSVNRYGQVDAGVALRAVAHVPDGSGVLLQATLEHADGRRETVRTRQLVLALGRDGSGAPRWPGRRRSAPASIR